MARTIRLEVDGVSAVARLYDDLSPKMVEAFCSLLPLERKLSHAKWSGRACFLHPGEGPLNEITELEYPVCSIYPGTLVVRPGGSEILMAYDQSEYRWGTGTDYTTPLAQITENRAAFLAVLESMHTDGEKHIRIQINEGDN